MMKLSSFLLLTLLFISISCDNEEDDVEAERSGMCITGVWYKKVCGGQKTQYWVFDADGTGYSTNPDCNNICEPLKFNYRWSVSGDECTVDYTSSDPVYCDGYGTNTPDTPNTDTFTFTCNDDELYVTSGTGSTTFYRDSGNGPGSDDDDDDGGSGDGTGEVLFWLRSDIGCGNIDVTVDNQTKTITSYYTSGAPDCGASGCATFTLEPGSYNFSASCSGETWSGSVSVTDGGCYKMELTGSDGGDGDGGDGGSSTGSAIFWTGYDHGCGPITVTLGSYSNTISVYYTSGGPDCGEDGNANFYNLDPGTYSWSATCGDYSWGPGTLTVDGGGCAKMKLN